MALRIVTWNVNGIRNPFGYQPWRDKRTFEGMFDLLEADIVVFQETKIQRKDLRDDMVLVPGWDCYWSLPRHKKGYSGVVIYTRNSKCAPIRAEEGITGLLCPQNTNTSFRNLPDEEQIGGYPSLSQLAESEIDGATIDSEGRCVILEFPAFVLIGTYCPAERDETRTHFRTGFLHILDSRIRNLHKEGKRVIWTGDLNISREEIDTAMSEETMRKNNVSNVEWLSSPARRLFNQLLVDGKVHGERDEGREDSVMWDICRGFHQGRKGMYTCWETKVNARPGNYGARIDYVLCSHVMKDWFCDSNIQEGLMGSDHCPVYAVLKDKIGVDGQEKHVLDLVNPPGMFQNGVRKQPWTSKQFLPMSGKLIQEFDRRQNIRDMFIRKPSLPRGQSIADETAFESDNAPSHVVLRGTPTNGTPDTSSQLTDASKLSKTISAPITSPGAIKPAPKRQNYDDVAPSPKRSKSNTQNPANGSLKGQKSLKGFFQPKSSAIAPTTTSPPTTNQHIKDLNDVPEGPAEYESPPPQEPELLASDIAVAEAASFATKKSWGKLFAKPAAPKCEHEEPCKTMQTKKPGVNCGRWFWMCARPLGPSGKQERGTQWRCNTFIWSSDRDERTEDPG